MPLPGEKLLTFCVFCLKAPPPDYLTTGSLLTSQIDSSRFSDRLFKLAPNPSNHDPSFHPRPSASDGCVYCCCFPSHFLCLQFLFIIWLHACLFFVPPSPLHSNVSSMMAGTVSVLSIPVSSAFRTEHIVGLSYVYFLFCFVFFSRQLLISPTAAYAIGGDSRQPSSRSSCCSPS